MEEPDLSAELRRRAEEAAAAMIRAAESEAARITAEADAAVERQQHAVLSEHEAAHRAESRAELAAARQEAMRAVLLAKTRVVERVFARVREALPRVLEQERYRRQVAEEVVDALGFVEGAEATVRCPPGLEAVLRSALSDQTAIRIEADPDTGCGFVVTGDGGRLRIDGTLETRLTQLAPTLAIEVHGQLAETLR